MAPTNLQVVNEQDLEQPAVVQGDRFEAVVPDDLKTLLSDAADKVVPAGDVPAAEAAAQPDKKAAPAPPGVIAERRKRQAAEERAARIEEQAARLRTRNAQLESTQIATVPRPEERWNALATKADAETDLKNVVRMILEENDLRTREYLQAQEVTREQQRIQRMERQFERDHPDFKAKLQEAGIFDGIKQVRNTDGSVSYVNAEMADAIYGEENPAKAAYDLAQEMLKIRARNEGRVVETEDEILRTVATPEPKREAPGKATAATVDLDAARREGAAQVTARLAAASDKPKGISALGSAGEPKLSVSKEDLDTMLETNPHAYERLIAANPRLGRWHLGE